MKKPSVSKKEMAQIHPLIPDAYDKLNQGRVSRREFLRFATLLGMSAGAAMIAAKCSSPATTTTEQISSGAIKRGGMLTKAMTLQALQHPASLAWTQGANVVRQVAEYLTETGPDNITRPYLLEKWEADDAVKTWTLTLRQGIKFNNGDDLTVDDVIFTMNEWFNPEVGSSMLNLLSYVGGSQNIERVDDYTLKLHTDKPNIGFPENLYHYPGFVLHRSFEGDFVKQPIGTGGFTLEEYKEGERAVLKRREGYWQTGQDGEALPYLDEVIYVSMDKDAALAALQSGLVDSMYQPRPSDWLALKDVPELAVYSVGSSQGLILRMRADLAPWDDERVRMALKKCQDREKILQLSYFGEGDLAIDAHVAPAHPAYAPKEIPAYDPEGAKALLAEAGYPDGLQVTLATKNDQSEPEIATALKELAAPGGFDITLDITEPNGYWERWMDVSLGITSWTHRPLSIMTLALAYTADEEGQPSAWNETHWIDEGFIELLGQAEQTLDIEARREVMSKIEDIMEERGPIGVSYWNKIWNITRAEFKNVVVHPSDHDFLLEVWKDA